MILDWDVHFGNGTMRAFSSDPRVLYISIHRYQHAKFFPCSEEGSHKVTGFGSGEGFTINIPWNNVSSILVIKQIILYQKQQFYKNYLL